MPVLTKLREFLDQNRVAYDVQTHAEAFTAQQLAQSVHIRGRDVAKVVIVRDGDKFHMVVLPAIYNIDLVRLAPALGLVEPRLATEEEFKGLFPGCELGAMPPFGNLYGVPVSVDRTLAEEERIVCAAGSHHQSVSMAFSDFARLVKPRLIDVAVHV